MVLPVSKVLQSTMNKIEDFSYLISLTVSCMIEVCAIIRRRCPSVMGVILVTPPSQGLTLTLSGYCNSETFTRQRMAASWPGTGPLCHQCQGHSCQPRKLSQGWDNQETCMWTSTRHLIKIGVKWGLNLIRVNLEPWVGNAGIIYCLLQIVELYQEIMQGNVCNISKHYLAPPECTLGLQYLASHPDNQYS